jgi:hypothetical protein
VTIQSSVAEKKSINQYHPLALHHLPWSRIKRLHRLALSFIRQFSRHFFEFFQVAYYTVCHPGRDSRQAILADALRLNANPFQTDLRGDPEAMDGNSYLANHFLVINYSEYLFLHPCNLDTGNTCRYDS